MHCFDVFLLFYRQADDLNISRAQSSVFKMNAYSSFWQNWSYFFGPFDKNDIGRISEKLVKF